MKYCPHCKENKSDDLFGKNKLTKDGLQWECRGCRRSMDKAYRDKHRVKRRIAAREYDTAHREENKARRCRNRTKEKSRAYWASCSPEIRQREITRHALQHAIRVGHIQKPDICQDCGAAARLHGHHEDYSRPFDVDWVCVPCHGKRHQEVFDAREEEGGE